MTEAQRNPRRTAIWSHPQFFEHHAGSYHPERPARLDAALRGARAAIAKNGGIEHVVAVPAPREAVLRVHDTEHLAELEAIDARGARVQLDPDTYMGPGSLPAAMLAAGGACAVVDALLDASVEGAMLLARPPGHHATRRKPMGFCLVNNIAVAAAHARARGVRNVAIVDWDVHHGNGTQDIFWSDGSVLFISLHQAPLYPDSGWIHDLGAGAGLGRTLNLPFLAAGDGALYREAFRRVVLPVLAEAKPELILVSAGFDAHARDPLASMLVQSADFGWMAARLTETAIEHAGGRIGFFLEGGYDLVALEESVAATLHGTAVPGAFPEHPTRDDVTPSGERVLDGVVRAAAPYWACLRAASVSAA